MPYTLRLFQDSDASAFLWLNRYWIERYFTYEPSDAAQLENPKVAILDKGGVIIIADLAGDAIGTIALIPKPSLGDGIYELVKMSVHPEHYGKGIGKALMAEALQTAKNMDIRKIWLETNAKLKTATHIYKSFGFVPLTDSEFIPTQYKRCNLQMELIL